MHAGDELSLLLIPMVFSFFVFLKSLDPFRRGLATLQMGVLGSFFLLKNGEEYAVTFLILVTLWWLFLIRLSFPKSATRVNEGEK
jgi:hypothetical protein